MSELLLAAAESGGGGLDFGQIAGLVAAVGGALGGLFAGVRSLRSDKFKRNVEAGATLLQGYTDMVSQLRNELDRVKEEQVKERDQWRVEREAMRKEFYDDRERMKADHHAEVVELNDRIDELSSQVFALTTRAATNTRTRTDDHL